MKDFRSSLKGIAALYRPFRWRVLVSILTGILRVAASMAFVWVSKRLIDIVTGESDSALGTCVWILAGIVLFRIAANVFASYWENLTVVIAQNTLRRETFSHLLRSRWNGREEYHSADAVNRIYEDIRVLVDLVCTRIPDITVTLCQLAAASVFLVLMAPGLLGLLVALMVIGIIGSRMFFRTQRRITSEIRNLDSDSQRHIQDNLQNRAIVLSQIGVDNVLDRFHDIQDSLLDASVRRLNYNSISRGFMSFGMMAGYTAAFLWGIFGIRDGSVTYGMMTAFLQLVGQVQMPLSNLARHIPAVIQSLTSEERLAELDALPEADWSAGRTLSEAPGIVFENVTFAYSDIDKPVLEDFNHEFPAGSLTVITGQTGRGKSTLVRLAMGLLAPQSGDICFKLSDGKKAPLAMSNYMYVPQDNALLSGTIRENLLKTAPGATEDMMKEALHTAVADFVFEFPLGLDTPCGESGSGISRGQAQRIAIARALLHSGTVLILDEATSALDSETENIFLERLAEKYRGKKTVLFVSHRGQVSSFADEILQLI